METKQVVQTLADKKPGQFITIKLDRVERIGGKKEGRDVRKLSTYQVQVKVSYANRQPVREAIEQGLRDEPTMPSWADQVEYDGVRLWVHKQTGEQYLPLPLVNSFHKVEYSDPDSGVKIDPATLKLPKKQPLKEGQVPFAACKLVNITHIS
jgi:hypothetical protein